MYETYKKGGKKPGTPAKDKSEELGSVYFYRHSKGGDERRFRELSMNDYGKKQRRDDPFELLDESKGVPANPRRTIIHGV